MTKIHPAAIIDPSAQLGENVEVGPWTHIGPDVVVGNDCVIHSHVSLKGPTVIGKNNRIFQFSTIGEDTPDMKFKGETTRLTIGDNNIFREGVTIHRGTVQDNSETLIGSNNLLMAYVHVGHDCVVGDHNIFVNNSSIAGHIHVGDWVFLSGYSMIHQFVKIGSHSFLGAGGFLNQDLPAYVMAAGYPAKPRTINKVGLERRGFSKEQIAAINRAYKTLYRQGLKLEEALTRILADEENRDVLQPLIDSVRNTERGIIR